MLLYIENPKDCIKPTRTDKFSKIGYKLNIQKSVHFFKPTIYQKGRVKKTFKIATPQIKYLGINLTKEVKDILLRTLKILIKGICGVGEDS